MPKLIILAAVLLLSTDPATAAITTTGLPWENPFGSIWASVEGNLFPTFLGIALIVACVMLAMGFHGVSLTRMLGVVAAGAIGVGVFSFLSLLGISAALL